MNLGTMRQRSPRSFLSLSFLFGKVGVTSPHCKVTVLEKMCGKVLTLKSPLEARLSLGPVS